ncbi:hypothetical protein [Nocardiopsis dassonvillei]|uniref:hypothetical protein n=1 Tax=Nocardiopsis dassonvillei TaxID=2014 RepID=UPI00362BE26D
MSYKTLLRMLALLPLPIEVPELGETASEHVDAIDALDRSRDLMKDQPMGTKHRAALESAILEWATLYELAAILENPGFTELHLELAERGASRTTLYLDLAKEEMDES